MSRRSASELVVLVTGYGAFSSHKVNPSLLAVEELKKRGLQLDEDLKKLDFTGIKLVVKELSVEYAHVDEVMPKLFEQYEPSLVVCVGVSSMAPQVTVEQFANCYGYCTVDNRGECPPGNRCTTLSDFPSSGKFRSAIDMTMISKSPLLQEAGVEVCVSEDAGSFLCDYVYCTAMGLQEARCWPLDSVFVHDPPLNEPHSLDELARQLQVIIKAILLQVAEKKK